MTDWGYRAAGFLAGRLPLGMSGCLADALADFYVLTHPRIARAVARRLQRHAAAPHAATPPTVQATYRAFARAVLDFLREDGKGPRSRVMMDDEARAILDRARADGGAMLLVSGHFGPWETALRILARDIGPLDALAAPHRSGAVERFFARRRAATGIETLSEGRAAVAALARLRAGGWVAALLDRACRARRQIAGLRGFVPIDRAPLLLARRAGARVLAGVSWREPDGALHVRFLEPFSLAPQRGGLSLQQGAARLQRFFDEHVRAHPTQWFEWSVPGPPPSALAAAPALSTRRGEAGA